MPWDCCDQHLVDTTSTCPSCGIKKSVWTVRHSKTRIFKITRQTWLEIELHDHAGDPLAGEVYRLEAHTGEVYEGELDEQGFQRVTVKRAGDYVLTFPKVDRWAWLEEHDEDDADDGLGPGPIEIELLDADDKPLSGEAYRLELPDGSVREGTLDDHGQAREDDLPGPCTLVFPGLDRRDFIQDGS